MNTLELDRQLNALIIEGRNNEAFLEFYDGTSSPRRTTNPSALGGIRGCERARKRGRASKKSRLAC